MKPTHLPAPREVAALLLAASALAGAGPAVAAEWSWGTSFTDASAQSLTELHSEIHRTHELGPGFPVEDLHVTSDYFDLHMVSGAVHLEPPIDGYPAGAFFVGEATVTFAPQSKRSMSDLEIHFGTASLDRLAIGEAYLFTLTGESLVDLLGIDAEPGIPFAASEEYGRGKRALRQTGMRLVHRFLNREGTSKGTVYALFAPPAIRTQNSPDAMLLYSLDPARPVEVALEVFGHENFIDYFDYTYHFFTLTECASDSLPFRRAGDLTDYKLRLENTSNRGAYDQQATLTLNVEQPIEALQLELTARLEVSDVRLGSEGDSLQFAQWRFVPDKIDFDEHLTILFDPPLDAGTTHQLAIESAGPLFDGWALADEDIWHPYLEDRDSANYELFVTVPKNQQAIAAGRLVSEELADGNRHYHYKTSRPHKRATFYVGNYETKTAEADDTEVEVFVDRNFRLEEGGENVKFLADEVANAVRVYNRILVPLELEHLRVTATPTLHGRGFEGLILVSFAGAGQISSDADFFRAHEVAHQWWGNMVQTKNWPEDRWLSEATAEYSAMEYYSIRFQKPERTRTQIRNQWIMPTFQVPEIGRRDLTGEKRSERLSEMQPIIAGGQNVYTKGPLVLHMLRYMFQFRQGSDEKFWMSLQDFIDKYKYQEASTQDFIDIVEGHMGGAIPWFWDQWIYGREIPEVRWTHRVEKEGGQWKLVVEGEQKDTEYILAIPVYIALADGRTATSPLILQGKSGVREMKLPSKPKKVSLNDNYEALVELSN